MSGPTIFVRFSNGGSHFVFTIRNPDRTFLTASLDRFGIKNILFITLFFIKRSMLVTGQECPVFGRFDIRMPGTGIRLNLNTDGGSVFGCLLYYSKIYLTKHACITLFQTQDL
jgi:hypothetical protein